MDALVTVAFPNAPQMVGQGSAATLRMAPAAATDAIGEIKKYKALLDEGVISTQEFEAKKRKLMGI